MYIWQKSNYKLMTGKWKIPILLEAGYKLCHKEELSPDWMKLSDRLYFHIMTPPKQLLPQEIDYFCNGLKMIENRLTEPLENAQIMVIAIRSIQFSDCDIQDEAFTAAAIQWASETFQFEMPHIKVRFDCSKGKYGRYLFDFGEV